MEARRQPIIHSALSDNSLKWEKEKEKQTEADRESLNFLSGYRKNIPDGGFLIEQMVFADFRVLVKLESRCMCTFTNGGTGLALLCHKDLADGCC